METRNDNNMEYTWLWGELPLNDSGEIYMLWREGGEVAEVIRVYVF